MILEKQPAHSRVFKHELHGNDKSRRVQEKCGFTYHYTNKDIHWKVMDDIRTEHITRLTKEEWKNRFEIRKLSVNERLAALDLAWRFFLQ